MCSSLHRRDWKFEPFRPFPSDQVFKWKGFNIPRSCLGGVAGIRVCVITMYMKLRSKPAFLLRDNAYIPKHDFRDRMFIRSIAEYTQLELSDESTGQKTGYCDVRL